MTHDTRDHLLGRVRYDPVAMTLHWLTVLLVVTQFLLAELWDFPGRSAKHLMIVAHLSFGLMLIAVLAVRIIWRLMPAHHVPELGTRLVRLASQTVHLALYGLLVAVVASGVLWRWGGGEALSFFGVPIPPPFGAFSKSTHALIAEARNLVAWTIIVLAAGHAAAALFHYFVLRDEVLWRMLPGLPRPGHTATRSTTSGRVQRT